MNTRHLLVLMLLSLLLLPHLGLAASKQYVAPGPDIVFADSAQTQTLPNVLVPMTLNGLQAGTGRVSNRYDKGTGSQPAQYYWRCWFVLNGTPSPGTNFEIYVFTSNGLHPDSEIGTTDATFATDRRRNGKLLGTVNVDQATATPTVTGSGPATIVTRYFSVGVWDATPLNLTGSATAHACVFNAAPPEMQ